MSFENGCISPRMVGSFLWESSWWDAEMFKLNTELRSTIIRCSGKKSKQRFQSYKIWQQYLFTINSDWAFQIVYLLCLGRKKKIVCLNSTLEQECCLLSFEVDYERTNTC